MPKCLNIYINSKSYACVSTPVSRRKERESLNPLPREISPNLSFKILINAENNFTATAIEDSFISQGKQIHPRPSQMSGIQTTEIQNSKRLQYYFSFLQKPRKIDKVFEHLNLEIVHPLWNTCYLPLVEYSLFIPRGKGFSA